MSSWRRRGERAALTGALVVGLGSACSLISLDVLDAGDGGGGPGPGATAGTSTGAPATGGASAQGGGGIPPTGAGGAVSATGTGSSAGSGGGSGGGDGGGGGSGAGVPCGGTSVLANDFDAADQTQVLWNEDDGSGDALIEVGEIVLRPPADGSNPWVTFGSRFDYDLRDDAIGARFLETLDTDVLDATTSLHVEGAAGDAMTIRVRNGQIQFMTTLSGAFATRSSVPYDAATMQRWRLRHAGRDVIAETSEDGVRWDEHGRVPTADLFDLSLVRVSFEARLFGDASGVGVARVDDVAGLVGGASHCPARALVDDFDDGVRSREWGRSAIEAECGPAETGGELRFSFVPGASRYCFYRTSRLFDIRGDGVVVRMASQATAPNAEGYLQVADPRGEGALITATGAFLAAHQRVPESVILEVEDYVAADEPWWRIRDDAGLVRFEVSVDGQVFRELAVSPTWFETSAVQLILAGGAYGAPMDPGVTAFDDFNLPPP